MVGQNALPFPRSLLFVFKKFFSAKAPLITLKSFSSELAEVAADFNEISEHVDAGSATILMERAENLHRQGGANVAGFTAAEFYFNVFIDQMCLVTDEAFIDARESARLWAITDSFFHNYPKYRTSRVTTWMNIWYEMLMRLGAV